MKKAEAVAMTVLSTGLGVAVGMVIYHKFLAKFAG